MTPPLKSTPNKNLSEPSTLSCSSTLSSLETEYISSLNEKELKAYHIAKSHLGSSFHLMKSNGFIEWKKKISK